MEATDQLQTRGGGDGAGGIEGEEQGGEVARVSLEGVFAVEDREALGGGAWGGGGGVGGGLGGGGVWGAQLVGVSGEDGGVVGEEEAEDLVAGFAWEVEEGEGRWGGWGWWENRGGFRAMTRIGWALGDNDIPRNLIHFPSA